MQKDEEEILFEIELKEQLLDNETKEQLEKAINKLERDKLNLAEALDVVKRRNETKRQENGKLVHSTRVPMTDTDSYIMNNKEGGFAPNYTPTAAVETEDRVIISIDIPEGNHEAIVVEQAVMDAVEITGFKPGNVLFDSSFATGTNLKEMSKKNIDSYSSAGNTSKENPAIRDSLNSPVSKEDIEKLPTSGKKGKLSIAPMNAWLVSIARTDPFI